MRTTLRKSMSTGGVPIDVVLKKPHPARPELVVLCDVSGSVAGFSHFTLQLVHALRQQFSRVRVFAFIDTTGGAARRYPAPSIFLKKTPSAARGCGAGAGAQMVKIHQGIENQKVVSLGFAAPHGVIGEE